MKTGFVMCACAYQHREQDTHTRGMTKAQGRRQTKELNRMMLNLRKDEAVSTIEAVCQPVLHRLSMASKSDEPLQWMAAPKCCSGNCVWHHLKQVRGYFPSPPPWVRWGKRISVCSPPSLWKRAVFKKSKFYHSECLNYLYYSDRPLIS